MATHLAAVLPGKGQPFEIQTRPTPKPGPDEILIAVKSVALNPADLLMRDQGLFISEYPAVIGFDMSGLVMEVGENVPVPYFQPSVTRVAAYSASAWKGCSPDYGPFQEQCLVPWQHAVPLPDQTMSWNHAATLPVSVQVPLSVWDVIGLPRMEQDSSSCNISSTDDNPNQSVSGDHVNKKEALLVWGASSSIGSMGVQTAHLMRQNPKYPFAAVYATAGSANHEYIQSLGADRVFDYKDPGVVQTITDTAKADGLAIRHCFLAIGQLAQCQSVLKAFVEPRQEGAKTAKIGSAVPIATDAENIDGVDVIFAAPSMMNEEERLEQFRYWMGTWLRKNLAKGTIKPSPEPSVVGKGLESINVGLKELAKGVSCKKLVVEISE
ncbi:alcohol dehydrogenase [Fusarium heterosporum]|uniref:Alcohol dehydrogenase n=1 Tax=Fusarium heterosporum TaxID=42747 RepID=A0A8H5SWX7_FUSHE|nr:alcohol dehydrogenase [Fusarium heterosporum]